MSVNKDESAIFDPMEQDPEYQNKSSSSREEEDLGDQWELPRIQSPTDVSLMADRRAQQILLERDLSMSDPLTAPPPSLDLMYSGNLRMGSDFSIEKVLGETTASILTQAEAEASHLASSWDIETGLDEPHSILSCRICQLFVRTVDRLLDKSEQFVDPYLPLTEEEIENLKRAVEEVDDSVVADHQMEVCMARINNLSSKLRQRAYMMALSKLRLARRNTQESLYQLHETIGLIEQAQSGVELESSRRFSVSVQWADSNPAESPLPSKIEIPRAGSKAEPHAPRLPSVVEIPQSPVAQDSVIEIAEVPLAQSTMMEAPQVSIAEIPPVSNLEMAPTPPPTPPPEEPEMPPPPPPPPIIPVEEPEMPPPPPPPPIIPVEEPEMPPPPPPPPIIPVEEPEIPPPPPPPPSIPVEEPKMPPPPPPPPSIPVEEPKMPPPPPPPPIKPTVESKIPPPPPPPPPEKPPKIHRDVKNITLTEPGCEDEDLDADLLQESCNPASEIETKTLATSRSVIHNLQGTYENLLENLKDLPPGLQGKLNQTYQHICELQSDFASAQHFGDLSGDVLSKSMEVMTEAQGSLDELMEYALENPDALVWLKDNLPPSAMEKKVLKPGEEEERSDILKIQKAYDPKGCDEETSIHDRVLSSRKEPRRNENILKVQKEYEPKGCDEETPPEPTQTSTPEQKARENILEILEAYDPKDCEEAPPTSREPGEEAPSSHIWEDAKEWKMFKMLQSYKPKFFEAAPSTNVEEEVAVVEPPSETEPEDRDILKIQAAYDPKGCDSEAPTDKEQTISSSSPEMEGWNILKIQAAHEPKGCESEVPEVMEDEDSPSMNLEVKDLLAIQKAYDPRDCDEMPPNKGERIVPPSSTQETKDWDIMKMVHSYTPKFSDEAPSTKQKKEPVVSLPDQQEKKESSALKIQELHDPKGCDGEAPILGDMDVSYSDSPAIGTRNILEIQKAYEPIECNEAGPRVTEEDIFPAGQWVVKNIVEIQKAYDPRDCTDDA